MRVDANVSVRRAGRRALGTRCEIKNLNSLRSLGRAIEYEAQRQIDLLEAGERVRQETRHWDEDDGRTHTLRSKEEADDYRYFPEPDLVPLEPDDAWIAAVGAALPTLPADRRIDLAERRRRRTDDRCGRRRGRARPRRTRAPAAIAAGGDPARVLTHVEHNLAVDGAGGARARRARRSSTRMEVDGAAHRDAGQGGARRDGREGDRRPRSDRRRRWASRRWRRARSIGRRRDHRRPPRRVAALPRGRREGAGQAHRLLRRRGHAGDEGQGRRQGRDGPAPRARRGVVDQPFDAASSLIAPESERRFAHAAT